MTALITALTALFIHIPAIEAIHPLTIAAKADHPATRNWLGGQLWAWDGGDAITVVTGGHYGTPDHRCYFVIREGNRVDVVEARSITTAMAERGYKVQVDHSRHEA